MKPFLSLFNKELVEMKTDNNDFRYNVTEILKKDIFADSDIDVLILTRRDDPESDILGVELANENLNYLRVNVDEFPKFKFTVQLSNNKSEIYVKGPNSPRINLSNTKVIIYRRFGLAALDNLSDSPIQQKYISKEWGLFFDGLIHLVDAKWINHPFISRRLNNFYQLKLANELGLKIPDTMISNNPEDIEEFYMENKQSIAKSIDSHFILYNNIHYAMWGKMLQENDFREHTDSMGIVPVVYQDYYDNCKEVRVTVVGEKVFGTLFDNNVVGDWHLSDRKNFSCAIHNVPQEIERACVLYLKKANLTYGAFDFLLTENGEYIFLEVNIFGDWRWIENHTKQPITQAIVEYCKNICRQMN